MEPGDHLGLETNKIKGDELKLDRAVHPSNPRAWVLKPTWKKEKRPWGRVRCVAVNEKQNPHLTLCCPRKNRILVVLYPKQISNPPTGIRR